MSWRNSLEIVPKAYIKHLGFLIPGFILVGILETIGLASILPLIEMASKPEIVETNKYLLRYSEISGLNGYNQVFVSVCLILLSIIIFKNVIAWLFHYYQGFVSFNLAADLSELQFYRFLQSECSDVAASTSGQTITNIRLNTLHFITGIFFPLLLIFTELSVGLVIVIFMSFLDFRLFLFVLIFVGSSFTLIYSVTKQKTKFISSDMNKLVPMIGTQINQVHDGHKEIKLNGKGKFFLDMFSDVNQRFYKALLRLHGIQGVPTKVNETIAFFAIILIFIYSIVITGDKENLFIFLGAFVVAAYRILPSLSKVLGSIIHLKSYAYVFEHLGGPNYKVIIPDKEDSPLFKNEISLEGISYKYEGSKGKSALQKVDIKIRKGEIVGIFGDSGAGKTTLVNLLLRLYKLQEGSFKVDGKDIRTIPKEQWWAKLGYVKQKIFLFEGSIRDNIVFGIKDEKVDENRLGNAIKLSGLGEWINSLPEGVDSMITEKGEDISGGQQQRIGVARALYKQTEILFLDEATSALDMENEKLITQTIRNLAKIGITTVTISHRYSAFLECDKILRLHKGVIIEEYSREDFFKKYSND